MTTTKKEILKKACGQGGPKVGVMDVVKEIPGTLKGMAKHLYHGLDPAGLIGKVARSVGNQIQKENEFEEAPGEKIRKELEEEKKEKILKDKIDKEKYKAPKVTPPQKYIIPPAEAVDSSKVGGEKSSIENDIGKVQGMYKKFKK
jgi:hypothetical protein